MSHINSSPEQIAALRDAPHAGPINMLNLLRFTPSGRERYAEYKAAVLPELERASARVVFMGAPIATVIGPDEEQWDEMISRSHQKVNEDPITTHNSMRIQLSPIAIRNQLEFHQNVANVFSDEKQ